MESAPGKSRLEHRMRFIIRIEYLSLAWIVMEVLGSLYVGVSSRSFALIAFGSDSIVELLSGYVILIHLKDYLKQGQSCAVFGNKKTELLTFALLLALIPAIGIGAAYSYSIGLKPEATPIGISIAVGAVIIMPYIWYQKKKISKEIQCLPLSVDAAESKVCFMMAVALLGSLLAEFFFGLWWANYLATAIILILIIGEAAEAYESMSPKRRNLRTSN